MNYRLILTTKHGEVFAVEFSRYEYLLNWLVTNLSGSYFVSYTVYNNEHVRGIVPNVAEFK